MEPEFQRFRLQNPVAQVKLEIELPRHLAAGSMARREIDRCFSRTVDDAVMIDLKLVADELVTNAVRHGVGEIRLLVQAMAEHVRLEVIDDGDGFVVPTHSAREKGLGIVEQLVERWGVLHGASTHVWCYLPGRPARRAAN